MSLQAHSWRPERSLTISAPPWKYNPSSWRERIPICILAGFAFVISSYVALYQWRLIGSIWDPVFGEQTVHVLDSDVSHRMQQLFGIPDAALGALAYLGDVVFGLAGSTRRWQDHPWLVLIFGLDVIPLGVVSAILVVTQATIVGYWCFLCLVTAAISLLLIYLAYDEVWSSLLYLHRVWRRTRTRTTVWHAFWGSHSVRLKQLLSHDNDVAWSCRIDARCLAATESPNLSGYTRRRDICHRCRVLWSRCCHCIPGVVLGSAPKNSSRERCGRFVASRLCLFWREPPWTSIGAE